MDLTPCEHCTHPNAVHLAPIDPSADPETRLFNCSCDGCACNRTYPRTNTTTTDAPIHPPSVMDDQVSRARELLAAATREAVETEARRAAGSHEPPWGPERAELIAAAPTLLAELADEVERMRAQLDITDEMVEQVAEVIWDVFDRHGHNGIECRPDSGMDLYSMEAARAALEAALGVES